MKVKRILTGAIASALLLSTTLGVSAVSEIERFTSTEIDMTRSYSRNTNNGVGYMYYHVGSMNWGDDAYAYSETKIARGMSGYASVSITGINGQKAAQYSEDMVDNSYIRTANAVVSGCDFAQKIQFMGARKENTQEDYVGYVYTIS